MSERTETLLSEFKAMHPDKFPEVMITFDECDEWEIYIGRLESYGSIDESGAMYFSCSENLDEALDLIIQKIRSGC